MLSTVLLGVCVLLIVYIIPNGVVGLIEDLPRATTGNVLVVSHKATIRLLLSSLAKHEHRAVVESYGHVNLGFAAKDLRKFVDKAGLTVAGCETVTREKRPPHFEVISMIGSKS